MDDVDGDDEDEDEHDDENDDVMLLLFQLHLNAHELAANWTEKEKNVHYHAL